MWFSTASIITACCSVGVRTCMRRASPMPGCGMSPSPAISLEVSTMMTRLWSSSASTRATSRSMVVLPTPGRPRSRTLCPDSTMSRMMSIVPNTARPMRQVRPTTLPARLRMAEMRCSVRSMPARLSSPKAPMCSTTCSMSPSVTSRSSRSCSPAVKRASGRRPRSITTSSSSVRLATPRRRSQISGGSASISASRSSVVSRRVVTSVALPLIGRVNGRPASLPAGGPALAPRARGA